MAAVVLFIATRGNQQRILSFDRFEVKIVPGFWVTTNCNVIVEIEDRAVVVIIYRNIQIIQ